MKALLALEDGRVFQGRSLGRAGTVSGEVVFNTGMTGYQEIMTDPSYRGQIVTLTVPHVGNTGINDRDPEAGTPQLSGLIVRAASRISSSWRAESELDRYMKAHRVVGIENIDTRALTRHLRSQGVVRGVITTEAGSEAEAIEWALNAPRIEDQDLVSQVTCKEPYRYALTRIADDCLGEESQGQGNGRRIVAIDFGVKRNILRLLAREGFDVTVVPASFTAEQVLELDPEGIFLSNGPGDPSTMQREIETVAGLIGKRPMFGICLGHQLVALAQGATTYKLKFGHRGINHPVREEATGRVGITSQNHGYSVRDESLPAHLQVSHRSLYDGTVEGLVHREVPLFTVQFHPEAAPGPHDTWDLFGRFATMIERGKPWTSAA